MSEDAKAVVVSQADRRRERFDRPERGEASWFTLLSGDIAPTRGLSAGLMELAPDGTLAPHRHAQAEIYFIHEGAGLLTVDGVTTAVGVGMTAYIPGDAEHSLRNDSDRTLKIFYVFPTDRFADVVYRFST